MIKNRESYKYITDHKGSVNFYAYCEGDAVNNWVDVDGLFYGYLPYVETFFKHTKNVWNKLPKVARELGLWWGGNKLFKNIEKDVDNTFDGIIDWVVGSAKTTKQMFCHIGNGIKQAWYYSKPNHRNIFPQPGSRLPSFRNPPKNPGVNNHSDFNYNPFKWGF